MSIMSQHYIASGMRRGRIFVLLCIRLLYEVERLLTKDYGVEDLVANGSGIFYGEGLKKTARHFSAGIRTGDITNVRKTRNGVSNKARNTTASAVDVDLTNMERLAGVIRRRI